MMPKDWRRAVLAVLAALPFLAAMGPAGATDAPGEAGVGIGVDHTMRSRGRAARGWVSAVDALDLLSRPAARPSPTRRPPPVPVASPIGGLHGLIVHGLDSAMFLLPSGPTDSQWTGPRPDNRPMPYLRFGEGEQVFGFSFKIQPPPQAPDLPSPGS